MATLAPIEGIHHLTAISADAQRTIDFYSTLLGQRLVKQTINFDDPASHHLYFADEEHGPGAITFFAWPGAPRGNYGIGGTHHLAYATENRETLRQWKRYLTDNGVPVTGPYDRVYFESIYFTDPDGLIIEIATNGPGWTVDEAEADLGLAVKLPPVETTAHHRDEAAIAADTWPEPVAQPTPEMRLRRMHHITAIGSDASRTEAFFTGALGLRTVKRTVNFDNPDSPHLYFAASDAAPGTIITYFAYPHGKMRPFRLGAGMTHHFALQVPDEDALVAWRDALNDMRVPTTDVKDRVYFKSIYLHDPDGHVVELATAGPGWTYDETPETLGHTLQLPPWLETERESIAGNLPPLRVPAPVGR